MRFRSDGQLLAAHRAMHYCYSCFTWESASAFPPSQIEKHHYECRPCNTARRGRQRGYRPRMANR